MNGSQLRDLLLAALPRLEEAREELRALDAAIGDGDLGITVAAGARAVVEELAGMADPAPGDVLRATARRFAAANPSTMSALVAAALLAAAKELGDSPNLDRDGAVRMIDTAAARISERGGAQMGDKTVLDALVPSGRALAGAAPDGQEALAAMAAAAREGVTATVEAQSRRGRAAWTGERSIGHPDGGATAYVRLLEALELSWAPSPPAADR